MTSSRKRGRRKRDYNISGSIVPVWRLPDSIQITANPNVAGDFITVTGTFTGRMPEPQFWNQPPHLVFANLNLSDLGTVRAFVQKYGAFTERAQPSEIHQTVIPGTTAREVTQVSNEWRSQGHLGELKSLQDGLRRIWGEKTTDVPIGPIVDASLKVEGSALGFIIKAESVWQMIEFLLARDLAAGKTAVCKHPECPAPYFLKKRKTQKYCESGSCVDWAHRQAALKHWRKTHKKGMS